MTNQSSNPSSRAKHQSPRKSPLGVTTRLANWKQTQKRAQPLLGNKDPKKPGPSGVGITQLFIEGERKPTQAVSGKQSYRRLNADLSNGRQRAATQIGVTYVEKADAPLAEGSLLEQNGARLQT